jgi:hypothetical protein
MGHSLEQSLQYVKLDAITEKPQENVELTIEEKEKHEEEPIKPKRPRGRPKKVVEPQVE